MDEDEDRGTASTAAKHQVTLVLQNFVAWKAYMLNEIKAFKSLELEIYIITGTMPLFVRPTVDTEEALDPTNPLKLTKKYADDQYGKEECGFDRMQVMKREVKFKEALPLSVSLAYKTIGAVVMRKLCLNPA